MLDRFIYGEVARISPEAPIPVFAISRESSMLGGAGNVVRNITALGGQASFLAAVGDDTIGRDLLQMVGREQQLTPYLQTEKGRISTRKTRYIAGNQQLLRADKETREPISDATAQTLINIATTEIPKHDVVILSDYGKGVLTPPLIAAIIALAQKAGKPVIVDPKGRNFSIYRGATVISPNLHELAEATGVECRDNESIIEAAHQLTTQLDTKYILVTRSKDGMTLVSHDRQAVHIPARAREVFDVSGAGDTAIATLSMALATGLDMKDAAFLANIAAGIVVGKLGTAVVHRTDLKTTLYTYNTTSSSGKILPFDLACDQIAQWKKEGKKTGFTNGCFDLLHQGHLALLQEARSQCDRLVVAINSDDSVRRLKGPTRPVNTEMERAMMLGALSAVDLVVIFREDTPLQLIEALRPDVLLKGADYQKNQVVGAELVESYGGEVRLIPLQEGFSTTSKLAKITGA
jgi:D-beta-D-heptose 7-phosphate kinase/D-beta-D-heptose 1-phosphate adenosyltransferase